MRSKFIFAYSGNLRLSLSKYCLIYSQVNGKMSISYQLEALVTLRVGLKYTCKDR